MPDVVRPLRNLLYVEKMKPTKTRGGILIPKGFRAGRNNADASLIVNATPDYYLARVLATGPDVPRSDLVQGDYVLFWTYQLDRKNTIYTGETTGEKNRLFLRYPDDIITAAELDEHDLELYADVGDAAQ